MSDQDKIIPFLRMNGPCLPSKVAKMLGTDILLASAHLSDLTSRGKLKISHLKIGGSSLYYIPGQEHQLYHFAADNLNPKDFQVLDKLKGQKVMREAHMDLLEKVAVRSLRDFAVPLQVTVQDKKELFWKWHLCSESETNTIIEYMIRGRMAEEAIEKPLEPFPTTTSSVALQEEKSEPGGVELLSSSLQGGGKLPTPLLKLEKITSISKKKSIRTEAEAFFPSLEQVFKKLSITIEQKETIRKGKEFDFVLKVPSAVGTMTYFCKAKNKNKCDEKDLSAAYMQAQIKKLPLLLLYTGELAKKAQEMLKSGAFENVMVRKV